MGRGDKPSGVLRGGCKGGREGAQPHNRPRLAPAGGGPSYRNRKALAPAGHRNYLSTDKPCFTFLRAPAAHTPNNPPAGGGQNNIKKSPRGRRAQWYAPLREKPLHYLLQNSTNSSS